MPKPLIGLTTTRTTNQSQGTTFGINETYAKAISNAGGLPVLIPLNISNDDLATLLFRMDGILFTGGYDVDPRVYGGLLHPRVERIDNTRDEIETHLVQVMVDSGKPFLGICRGLQVINVAMGGSLYEHLPDQIPGYISHDNHHLPRNFLAHIVNIEPDSHLSQIFVSNQIQVNSLHHQGLHRLAHGLLPTAYAPDGLIEAIEMPEHPFGLAVQWHPEDLQEHEAMRKLFQVFVHSC